ncbi:MAG: xanthine dehydrogenase accessory protein XdhC [Sphingomonas bacterium]|uniref:xanthine dehydrogenase accessory protein XdhC n=1 Tax=Sphingomonas bacterium TaxID=1895847 RepID=UPI002629C785|nr:xanthine dehydrogenase accessory protein XdhC [Sphingomonas bacterium]MDB5706082.1 xanthine dehydrogenase accessory protein XdhC [Sphingomonas bacterium]
MADWPKAARVALAQGPTALVTILATEGSAPRGAGARMVVTGDALHGTIGGGALEWRVTEQARAILALPPGSWRVQDYPLGPLLGQCCGGRVRLLVERLDPVASEWIEAFEKGEEIVARLETETISRASFPGLRRGSVGARGPLPEAGVEFTEPMETPGSPLILFGAGHVGRAIADRAPGLPLHLAWFDSREDAAAYPGVMLAEESAMIDCARTAPADAAILIVTHDHGLDYKLTAAALAGEAGYVGLIGSATKRARFLSRLAEEGVGAARLICPIGLPGVTGKEPAVIAIAALAQILSLGQRAA